METKQLMNTISGTYKRCKDENIGISYNHLRYLCKERVIPTCRIGKKHLINWDILMDYLSGKNVPQVVEAQIDASTTIIPINKKKASIIRKVF